MKIAAAALLCIAITSAFGQQASPAPAPAPCATGARPSFDVVSVKQSQTDSHSSSMRGTPDGVIVTSSLRRMILSAFKLHDFQLSGGPDWVATSTWVLTAKDDTPDADASTLSLQQRQVQFDKRMQQLQSALMDRFQLKCHIASKDMPIYELVQVKGGAKLKPTTAERNKQGNTSINGRNGQAHAVATGITSDRIAEILGNETDRLVINKTVLTGSYDLTLDWAPNEGVPATDAPSAPSLFTAVEEQLGLKLVPAKGPVPVLIIDAVEKPGEN
jgi:uncharacterized protein (TIGR03435 family)